MSEKREFVRTPFDARVMVHHQIHGMAIFRTADISDGGLFLQTGPFELLKGDAIKVQIQDVPIEAPVVQMTVVRLDAGGYGVRFDD